MRFEQRTTSVSSTFPRSAGYSRLVPVDCETSESSITYASDASVYILSLTRASSSRYTWCAPSTTTMSKNVGAVLAGCIRMMLPSSSVQARGTSSSGARTRVFSEAASCRTNSRCSSASRSCGLTRAHSQRATK
eukprot:scaffold4873_cov74-Phaeocystis_antarctica.AAC.4